MAFREALTREELDAWLPFMAVLELLPPAVNSALQHASGHSLLSLYVLGHLRRAPDRAAGVSELAACTSSALPRMSRALARLESDGLIARSACATDGRAVMMTLTVAGEVALERAMPHHDRILRELLVDALSPEQLGQLREIATALAQRLHPDGSAPIDRQRTVAAA
jgi:DNA-binding MarR family transcriptional regulator